jgi:hypothetical protein
MLSCAAVRSSLGGLTQKQLDGIINVWIANKADIKEYLGEKINLHNGRGVVYPFLQKGCDGDDVTQRENPFAKRYVLDLRIEGLDIATHEENNMIEEYVAKICETSYHTGWQNENTKTAMSMLLWRYGTWMDAYKTKLWLETVWNRSFTKVVERGKDFGSARFDHDSPEALFIVLKRIHTETIDE